MKYLYLLLNLFTVSFPLLRSFEPKIRYAKKWRTLFPAIVMTATFFIIWDVLFTQATVWGFNERYLTGLFIFGLPIEEWLFFFTVPFASVFIYECVIYFLPFVHTSNNTKLITLFLGSTLLFLSITNYQKMYTFCNFSLAGSFLIYIAYLQPKWLAHFWIAYGIHLIPFLLVNGILTGSITEEPIVWYNNHENLSLRIFTIPIEDTIYALLLLLMNVTLYERLNIFNREKT